MTCGFVAVDSRIWLWRTSSGDDGDEVTCSYDAASKESILRFAERLVGRTLRDVLEALPPESDALDRKGDFGNVVERYYFGYEPNSRPEPDFVDAGIELKTTPLKMTKRGELVPKERLVLGMIDYMTLDTETWESSTFLNKSSCLLVVFYIWNSDRSLLDHPIHLVRLWEFPPEDLRIIREDWEKIASKVRLGLAHEISGGDTLYLEACTKASNSLARRPQPHSPELAKPRAFALKPSYIKTIINPSRRLQRVPRAPDERSMSFEQLVLKKFEPFVGLSDLEIGHWFGIEPGPKHFHNLLTKRMLGVESTCSVAEFEKADLQVKTIRIERSGVIRESISFPVFKFCDVADTPWEASGLYDMLSKRFLFVMYRRGDDGALRFIGGRFWTMPVADLEQHARLVYERTAQAIRAGRPEDFPRISDDRCCHVRPHGRTSADTLPFPDGTPVTKRSFWLNARYVADQLGTDLLGK